MVKSVSDLAADVGTHDRITVLGNSGSLLLLPKQDEWVESLVIGVNRILRPCQTGYDRSYHPDVIVASDMRVLQTEIKAFRTTDAKLLFDAWMETDLPCYRFRGGAMQQIWSRRPIATFSMLYDAPVPHINNVSFQATQIGLRLLKEGGTLIVAGCEIGWADRFRDRYRRRLHNHYHSGRLHPDQRPFPVPIGYTRQWGYLKKFASTHSKHLYQCSPWPDLALPLPYKSITES